MSTALWVAPVTVYVVVLVWLWRRFAWRVAWAQAQLWSHDSYLDGGNIMVGIWLGFIQALFWPITLLVRHGLATERFYGFLSEPRASRRVRREARIAQLERELDIR